MSKSSTVTVYENLLRWFSTVTSPPRVNLVLLAVVHNVSGRGRKARPIVRSPMGKFRCEDPHKRVTCGDAEGSVMFTDVEGCVVFTDAVTVDVDVVVTVDVDVVATVDVVGLVDVAVVHPLHVNSHTSVAA